MFASTELQSPEERLSVEEKAKILERLGFKQCACIWWDTDLAGLDAGLDALERHGISILSWRLLDADNPR